ncbi:RTC4-like domain-containing protein, partial [Mycena sp. CBHHK59/15]
FISPETDPKTLCPYCDTPLPARPTLTLMQLLEQTFHKSYRDVRPANPLERKAPVMAFAALCQRHFFESEAIPQAMANGWPTSINWKGLKDCVLAMKGDLEHILVDLGAPIVYGSNEKAETLVEGIDIQQMKGPRMRCIFWRELLKELKSSGLRHVSGVGGQLATFEKTQPGYYGELGSVIMHQTLYDMFPPSTINSDLVHPLTLREFIGCILVPEVGMRLIMQDMSLDIEDTTDKNKAVEVLRGSASYGVAMFPEDGGK